jgi:hypothetical protein
VADRGDGAAVHSLVSFSAHLTVAPGNLVVTVKFTIKT